MIEYKHFHTNSGRTICFYKLLLDILVITFSALQTLLGFNLALQIYCKYKRLGKIDYIGSRWAWTNLIQYLRIHFDLFCNKEKNKYNFNPICLAWKDVSHTMNSLTASYFVKIFSLLLASTHPSTICLYPSSILLLSK